MDIPAIVDGLMNLSFRVFLFIMLLSIGIPAYIQAQQDSIPYSKEFYFKEGFYFTVEDLKKNSPTVTPAEFRKANPESSFEDKDFMMYLNNTGRLKYDSAGFEKKIRKEEIFAFCRNRTLYIKWNRVAQFGKVCLVSSEYQGVYRSSGLKPPENNMLDPLGMPNAFPPKKDEQFLISFDTGNIYEYSVKDFEFLLTKKDTVLASEYSKLSRKDKKNSLFIYLRKLNDRNPVYIKTQTKG